MREVFVVQRRETVTTKNGTQFDSVSYLSKRSRPGFWTNIPGEVLTFDTAEEAEVAAFNANAVEGSKSFGMISVSTIRVDK